MGRRVVGSAQNLEPLMNLPPKRPPATVTPFHPETEPDRFTVWHLVISAGLGLIVGLLICYIKSLVS